MQFDIDAMSPVDRYELLLGTIVPRPIALITTLGSDGQINAAPYSLFNVMGHDPAVAMVSVLAHPEARLKDTANNILATKEFVINLVSETVAEAMNITCIDAPPGVNELELANLKTVASMKVKPPRVATSSCGLRMSFSFVNIVRSKSSNNRRSDRSGLRRRSICTRQCSRTGRHAGIEADRRYAWCEMVRETLRSV